MELQLRSIGTCLHEVARDPAAGMRVPARVFADDELLAQIRRDRSLQQLVNVTSLPGIEGAALGMPDMHEGYGFPVGGVAGTRLPDGVISPGGIGFDINCGVRLLASQMHHEELAPHVEALVHEISRSIPAGYGRHGRLALTRLELDRVLNEGCPYLLAEHGMDDPEDLDFIESRGALEQADAGEVSEHAKRRGEDQLGTLGGGNHFIEVQRVEAIYDEAAARQLRLFLGQVTVLIHTGSRGLGHQVCTDQVRTMDQAMKRHGITVPDRQLACVPFSSPEGKSYFAAMCAAANFGWCNRQVIAHRVRLVGPPGTGKTLLARAVAGEAGVPFFSISGSEFVEMFVGVGAARVRDLFEQARSKAPCIIFVDELDALGRARGAYPGIGGHDEKEQTLNQLLSELDGFDPTSGIVLLAATNRPEILDPALLRAGRFDRQVLVDRPDRGGRAAVLSVHLQKVQLDADVDPDQVAALTPGFTGADLANLVNEAALVATRRGAARVAMSDFTSAIERIVAGLEKKNRLLIPRERKVVAHHEMGHALVAAALPGCDPIHKVSIIPRGIGALGYTIQRPTDDRYLMTRAELENKIAVLLGGRAAESLRFDELSTGAADDLAKATDIAMTMITRYAMVPELGNLTYDTDQPVFLGPAAWPTRRNYSEQTAREIDCAARTIIDRGFGRARAILERNRQVLLDAAALLLEKETLSEAELRPIFARVLKEPLASVA